MHGACEIVCVWKLFMLLSHVPLRRSNATGVQGRAGTRRDAVPVVLWQGSWAELHRLAHRVAHPVFHNPRGPATPVEHVRHVFARLSGKTSSPSLTGKFLLRSGKSFPHQVGCRSWGHHKQIVDVGIRVNYGFPANSWRSMPEPPPSRRRDNVGALIDPNRSARTRLRDIPNEVLSQLFA